MPPVARVFLAAGWVCLAVWSQDVRTRPADPELSEGRGATQYAAKIVMEDGTAPPLEMRVQRTGWCRIGTVFGNGTITFTAEEQPVTGDARHVPGCPVWIVAPGVRSQYVTLRDAAVIVLKRLGVHEGSMISLTVLKAPAKSKKAYARGAEELQRRRPAEARKYFEEAVAIYPEYAVAWSELGGVLQQLGLTAEARQAFRRAIEADRMYLKPLVQLAALEAAAEHWPECIRAADSAIKLHPVEFPGAYYYRAVAHLQAREWDRTIALSEKAIGLDPNGDYPQAHFLLALALEHSGQRLAAADAMDRFLSAPRTQAEAARAREYLQRLRRPAR